MLPRFLPIPPLVVGRNTDLFRIRDVRNYLVGNNFNMTAESTVLSSFLSNVSLDHGMDVIFSTTDPLFRTQQKILLKATRGTDTLNTYIDIYVEQPFETTAEFIEHTHPLPDHTHDLPEHTHPLPDHTHDFPEHTHDLPEHTHPHTHTIPPHTHEVPEHTHPYLDPEVDLTTNTPVEGEQQTGVSQNLNMLLGFADFINQLVQPYFRRVQWWAYNLFGGRPKYGGN